MFEGLKQQALERFANELYQKAMQSPDKCATLYMGYVARRNFSGYKPRGVIYQAERRIAEITGGTVSVEDLLVNDDLDLGRSCARLAVRLSL